MHFDGLIFDGLVFRERMRRRGRVGGGEEEREEEERESSSLPISPRSRGIFHRGE